ncbi:MAG: restriction endonuclease subunit S [Treponema sp.]|nr:restriction endonuclease subunit S [Treponema sp.]
MKTSGVEWIDEIPEDWEVTPLKKLFSFGKGLPITKENLVEKGLPVISYGQIHSKSNTGTKLQSELLRYVSNSYLDSNPNSLVHSGDFIFADTSEDLEGCGNCCYIDKEIKLFAGYHTVILQSKISKDNKYLAYLFKTDEWRKQLREKLVEVKLYSITQKALKSTSVILPPKPTQQRIASYLDKKCSKIEETIQNQQQVIEKLKAYKQSLITEAISGKIKIQNGKVCGKYENYKDSGVEWIGKIPSEWILSKFKFISKEIGDGLHGTPTFDESGDIYFLNGTNIGKEKLFFKEDTDRINSLEYEKYKHPLLSKYTIFIALNGATYGKTSFYNNEKVLLGKSAGYITFDKKQNILFLRYYLQSYAAKKNEEISLLGSTIQNLSLYTLNNFSVPLPSEIEQNSIVEYLDKKCIAIDTAIEQKQNLIEKLTEYKKSLIYECVTGKKEVN